MRILLANVAIHQTINSTAVALVCAAGNKSDHYLPGIFICRAGLELSTGRSPELNPDSSFVDCRDIKAQRAGSAAFDIVNLRLACQQLANCNWS